MLVRTECDRWAKSNETAGEGWSPATAPAITREWSRGHPVPELVDDRTGHVGVTRSSIVSCTPTLPSERNAEES